MANLAPCPCGKTPKSLGVNTHKNNSWATVYGDCCARWGIEFRTTYLARDPQKLMVEGARLWNGAPRAEQKTCEWVQEENAMNKKPLFYSGPYDLKLGGYPVYYATTFKVAVFVQEHEAKEYARYREEMCLRTNSSELEEPHTCS